MSISLHNADCLEQMKTMADKSVDAIITDPPYFLPARHYATRKSFRRNFSDLMFVEFFFRQWFEQAERILKPTGHLYMFCDGQSYPLFFYYSFFFTKSVRPIIWDKQNSINGYAWRHQHEIILFAEMPEAKPIPTGDGDIIKCKPVPINEREHAAEKPVELLEVLVNKCGQVICDPFMGKGSTGQASIKNGHDFIGIEIDPKYFGLAQKAIVTPPNTACTPTAFGVGTQAANPLQGSFLADDLPATNGGG